MGKKDLTEQEIRTQDIRPVIVESGSTNRMICEEYQYTVGPGPR